ncbi:uncharacterized protein (TIGR00369 family) [Saccharothrix coeruleofusca]|uniref:PaaI family thioesterase n=1 Tax=Saccharothrix coeruleofusca TaxID=33919 RepID=UPI001AE8B23A|nr:PaaI family thioesterase [Saccharothrix coeruleofusca]MBP2337476.1 uncharacterized protein (TIGR00369 family) [Saccharothrix coeruleofusca]
MSGLELLRSYSTMEQPPPSIVRLLGMELTRVAFGEADFELTTRPLFANPLGAVHGGIAATLLDSAMGCAVHSTLEAGAWYTTLELNVNYVRTVRTDGQKLIAEGRTVHVGRSTATAEARIHDRFGHLVAHGTTTCLIRRANDRPARSAAPEEES